MNKAQYRIFIKEKLKSILNQRKEEAAHNLLNKFGHFKSKNILSFASMKEEINLWPLNQKLITQNNLFLPKIHGNKLRIFKIESLDFLKKSSLGILEPDITICNESVLDTIDIIFVPGLAFDKKNNRLGYGKGFYDKLLNNYQGMRIGLCFREQILKSIPIESHDQKVNQFFSF